MTRMAQVKLHWLPREQGGRQVLPSGSRYVTVARFYNARIETDWSLVVDFEPTASGSCDRANVKLLSPEAPAELLNHGNHFDLLEGSRVVAKGKVLVVQNMLQT